MSELYGISNVERREDTVRQYKAAHETVAGVHKPQESDITDGGNGGGYAPGPRQKRQPHPENETDGIGESERHDFDVTV